MMDGLPVTDTPLQESTEQKTDNVEGNTEQNNLEIIKNDDSVNISYERQSLILSVSHENEESCISQQDSINVENTAKQLLDEISNTTEQTQEIKEFVTLVDEHVSNTEILPSTEAVTKHVDDVMEHVREKSNQINHACEQITKDSEHSLFVENKEHTSANINIKHDSTEAKQQQHSNPITTKNYAELTEEELLKSDGSTFDTDSIDISSINLDSSTSQSTNKSCGGDSIDTSSLLDKSIDTISTNETIELESVEIITKPREPEENIVEAPNAEQMHIIEEIKNDWTETESVAIEEISNELPNTSYPSTSSKSDAEPVVFETEQVNETVTELIVLEQVSEPGDVNADQGINIAIIDESKSKEKIATDVNVNDNKDKDVELEVEEDKEHEQQQEQSLESMQVLSEESSIEQMESADDNNIEDRTDNESKYIINKNLGKITSRIQQPKEEKSVVVPCHLLGRNVENPTEDLISNGRTPPKPRLGVKVPYRFLTSQIVSRQEIAEELLEMHAKRNPDPDPPIGGDIFFAKKLTQRLASKINRGDKLKKVETASDAISGIPEDALKTKSDVSSKSKTDANASSSSTTSTSQTPSTSKQQQQPISDNSDLLAILEGQVDVDLTKEIRNAKPKAAETVDNECPIEKALEGISSNTEGSSVGPKKKRIMDPEMEREIALKQLESLPQEPKKSGGRRGRRPKYLIYEEPVRKEPPNVVKAKASPESLTDKKSLNSTATVTTNSASTTPTKSVLNVQDANTVSSETVKKAAENILDKIKLNKINELVSKIDDDMLDANLTPKKVSKTYSRKEQVVNVVVPADLEQIVNDQSAFENDEVKDNKEKEDNEKVSPQKTPTSSQKKQKRLISDSEVVLVSKRARIIKPKIIWDPAESNQLSSALRKIKQQQTSPDNKSKRGRPRKTSENKNDSKEGTDVENVEPSEETKNKAVEEKLSDDNKSDEKMETETDEVPQKKVEKLPQTKSLNKLKAVRKLKMKRGIRPLLSKTNGNIKATLLRNKKNLSSNLVQHIKKRGRPMMRKSQSTQKKTELDRLLMDEGAVNMLYSVRQDDKMGKRNSTQKLIPSKDLLYRTKALRKVITQSSIADDSTKALRKKDTSVSPQKEDVKLRKKSRDSIRSSLQSPPPSPSYAFNRAEASRIIRRHSSSFSSDCSSPRRLSIDTQNQTSENVEKQEVKSADQKEKDVADLKKDTPDFTSPPRVLRSKPSTPSEKKTDDKALKLKKKSLSDSETIKESDNSKIVDIENNDRLKLSAEREKSSVYEKRKQESNKKFEELTSPKKRARKDVLKQPKHISINNSYNELNLKKMDNVVQIILASSNTTLENFMNYTMLAELRDILLSLKEDDSCQVVLITSDNVSCFTRGLDFSELIQPTLEKRISVAKEMINTLGEFIRALANFPKPILAGVQGSAIGLGVTILPLFDMVYCNDSATFSTPYACVGQVPEGIGFITLPHVLGNTLTNELLLTNRKLNATEAVQGGLVTKTFNNDKFQAEIVSIALTIASQRSECMMYTKSVLRQSLRKKLEDILKSDKVQLLKNWSDDLCQENFQKRLQGSQEDEWW